MSAFRVSPNEYAFIVKPYHNVVEMPRNFSVLSMDTSNGTNNKQLLKIENGCLQTSYASVKIILGDARGPRGEIPSVTVVARPFKCKKHKCVSECVHEYCHAN